MNKIQKIIENGYKLEVDQIYNDTFHIYKKMVVPAGAILLMLSIIFGGIYMAILFSFFDTLKEITTFLETFKIFELSYETLAYYALGNAAINGITAIIGAGFIKMAAEIYQDELPKFSSVFSFFIKIEGLKIFLFSFLVQLIYNIISFALDANDLTMVSFFILILIHVLTLLVVPFIIFDKLSINKAVITSIALVNQKPFRIMSLVILLGALSFAGLLIFAIGIIITLPILYCFNYSIYENIVNKN